MVGVAPGQYLWTQTHADCSTPYKPCEIRSTWTDATQTIVYECGKVKNVSYVNSSRYESETTLQEAERKLAEYREQVRLTQKMVDRLKKEARFGTEPTNGSMLKIEKRFETFGSAYYYGAIRVGDRWYMTCSEGYQKSPMTWEQLKTFIGDSKFWVPRNYEQAPSA